MNWCWVLFAKKKIFLSNILCAYAYVLAYRKTLWIDEIIKYFGFWSFFMKLAGSNRPVALAQANAILNRLDLLCEVKY